MTDDLETVVHALTSFIAEDVEGAEVEDADPAGRVKVGEGVAVEGEADDAERLQTALINRRLLQL